MWSSRACTALAVSLLMLSPGLVEDHNADDSLQAPHAIEPEDEGDALPLHKENRTAQVPYSDARSLRSSGEGGATVVGYVWGRDMRPVQRARVSAYSTSGEIVGSTRADALTSSGAPTGLYVLHGVPEGVVRVEAYVHGRKTSDIITVKAERLNWLNLSTGDIVPPVPVGAPTRPVRDGSPSSPPIGALALYYVDEHVWDEPHLLPLVAHISPEGDVTGRMYDGVIVYSRGNLTYRDNAFGGPTRSDFHTYMNETFSMLDTLDRVSGRVMTLLNDRMRYSVVLTAVYFKGEADASWSVSRLMSEWARKGYANLSLAGFYWGYSEGEIDATYQGVRPTADMLHSLGLDLFWCPFFLAPMWPYWRDMGFDHVVMQPNYAFNRPDPWRFDVLDDLLASGEVHGAELEVAYTRNGLSIEENANAYLDAGFREGWWGNRVNVFYHSPGYLEEYARGGAHIPPQDRPIYDRQFQFIRLAHDDAVRADADAYLVGSPAFRRSERHGQEPDLLLVQDGIVSTSIYLRFTRVDPEAYVHRLTLRLHVKDISRPCLVEVRSTGWGGVDEHDMNWMNSPAPGGVVGLLVLKGRGWVSALLRPPEGGEMAFILMGLGCEARISSKEGLYSPVLTMGYVEPVSTYVPVIEDTFVSDAGPSLNFGRAAILSAGVNATGTTITYLKFDMGSLPGWFRGRVDLEMNVERSSANITPSFDVMRISNVSWTEGTLTWSSQPGGTWEPLAVDVSPANGSMLVRRLALTEDGRATVLVVPHGGTGPGWSWFGSRESGSGPGALILLKGYEQQV